MPGPSSDSKTSQTSGPATAEETQVGGIAGRQATTLELAGKQAVTDPRIQLATLDSQAAELRRRAEALRQWDEGGGGGTYGSNPNWVLARNNARAQVQDLLQQAQGLESSRGILQKQAERLTGSEEIQDRTRQRMLDIIEGRDLGVSPQEQALITQGISGISQDVATTRGLNRSDVPVMQAVAPAVSAALLQQANANRSLFTGINQFQQGMDLSGRQLQAGLAGQNPAANLTGVYSGLRSTDFSTSGQAGYGGLDYIVQPLAALGSAAQGVGGALKAGQSASGADKSKKASS